MRVQVRFQEHDEERVQVRFQAHDQERVQVPVQVRVQGRDQERDKRRGPHRPRDLQRAECAVTGFFY